MAKSRPLVVDPFAGGGSIPLEALRLGCEAFASDLNPVACLILKVMLEDIPRHGLGLAEELRKVGGEIKRQAERELADLYPTDPDGATPIAYLWARTVRCEAPDCGVEIPLMRSFWLCKKAKRKHALRHRIERLKGAPARVEFEVFEPKVDEDVPGGTVTRAKATCVCCGVVLPPERVRAQLAAQKGGADAVFDEKGRRTGGARMTAVVTLHPGQPGDIIGCPPMRTTVRCAKRRNGLPESSMRGSAKENRSFARFRMSRRLPEAVRELVVHSACSATGCSSGGDLFTARQKVVLVELGQLISKSSEPLGRLLATAVNRTADGSASVSSWLASGEEVKHVFARQALPIVWDFGESNYMADASRSWTSAISSVAKVLEGASWELISGQVQQADATEHPLPDQSAGIWFTDPPTTTQYPMPTSPTSFLSGSSARCPTMRCCATPSIQTTLSHLRRLRRCRMKRNMTEVGQRIVSGSRKRWQKPSPRGGASSTKTASARSSLPIRRQKGGRRCSQA